MLYATSKFPDYFFGAFFLDINECASDNGGCEEECFNTDGSFGCLCGEGFEVVDGFNCEGQ